MNHNKNRKMNKNIKNAGYLPNSGLGWWKIIVAFFFIWIIASFFIKSFEGPSKANISYTRFIKEVKDKNVASITIQGDQISGKFQN